MARRIQIAEIADRLGCSTRLAQKLCDGEGVAELAAIQAVKQAEHNLNGALNELALLGVTTLVEYGQATAVNGRKKAVVKVKAWREIDLL